MRIDVFDDGRLVVQDTTYRCALGRSGVRIDKMEGDGATPAGIFPVRRVLYRADRIAAPKTILPAQALTQDDGWVDDVQKPQYNTFTKLPYNGSHEKLWRDDHIYDVIVVIGYNDNPPVAGRGSAIFIHIAREKYTCTAGCIALARTDILEVLSIITLDTEIVIHPHTS